jgi:pyrroline-5-carboxylate reductase
MARAIISGLLSRSEQKLDLVVVDRNVDKCEAFRTEYGALATLEIGYDVCDCDVLLLAVKPQDLRNACLELAGRVRRALVISVAAGSTPEVLSDWLGGHRRVVWAMPNTPAMVGQAVAGLYALADLSEADRRTAEHLFGAIGSTLWLPHEAAMDALTAVAGCGPAYVFFMMEALERAACELGFDARTARFLSASTFIGALRLLEVTGESPADLRSKVATKGGITERAIRNLEASGFSSIVAQAVNGANARAAAMRRAFNLTEPEVASVGVRA